MVTHLFWRYEDLDAFCGQEMCPGFISDGLVLLRINSRPHSKAESKRAVKIRWRVWICHPANCVSFLPWSITCQYIVSTGKKTSNVLPPRGCGRHSRELLSTGPWWTNTSHIV